MRFSALLTRYRDLGVLGILVSWLKATAKVHQHHHWTSKGTTFYSNHLLFERLYNETFAQIDSLAERYVGMEGETALHPLTQLAIQNDILLDLYQDPDAQLQPFELSLDIEQQTLQAIADCRANLEQRDLLSNGVDNLLQGIADGHESLVYLLKQSVKPSPYDFR